ncbi:hypothetical protein [Hymenobacter elongatus]|uniref:Uncharacterized protein n=1 Tax=Hymenobacter elongatus TaxID=877208 RepID=A0A4Z0PLK5_9BACT|nr:hypothetical protein [Hymenobacter elongatus]TGE16842.1 hypothetical protein E5J99_09035 [Hymenobacter elongatus]
MTDYELKDIDPEDMDEILTKVEWSFNIRFVSNELAHIRTFGELCDYITAKIPLDHSSSCTSQQAFYKLRKAFSDTLPLDSGHIAPATLLTDLLPRQNREQTVQKIEHSLGFRLNLLSIPGWLSAILGLSFLISIAGFFISWQVGVAGMALSILGFRLADRFASNTLQLKTVGQVAKKMTREDYLRSRRNPHTFNRDEVSKVLTELFSTGLDLDKADLTREARFV